MEKIYIDVKWYVGWKSFLGAYKPLVNKEGSYYGDIYSTDPKDLQNGFTSVLFITHPHPQRCGCDKCRGIGDVWDQTYTTHNFPVEVLK